MLHRLKKRILTNFYLGIEQINFENIDEASINNILNKAKALNEFYTKENFKHTKIEKYFKIIEIVNSGYTSSFYTNSAQEKFLLFLYSIDPEFDTLVIYGSEKDSKNIEKQMIKKFGLYDENIIVLENMILKNVLTNQKKEEINLKIKKNN